MTLKTLVLSALLLVGFTGCNSVRLYPIEQTDIIAVKSGGSLTAPKDGYFLSNEYVKEVMKAQVGK